MQTQGIDPRFVIGRILPFRFPRASNSHICQSTTPRTNSFSLHLQVDNRRLLFVYQFNTVRRQDFWNHQVFERREYLGSSDCFHYAVCLRCCKRLSFNVFFLILSLCCRISLTIFSPRLLRVPLVCLIFHSSVVTMSYKHSLIK